jgi:hypothetical protein
MTSDVEFLTREQRTLFEFLLRLHKSGKASLVADNSIDGLAQHIHRVLFPADNMAYVNTQRACNFWSFAKDMLDDAGICITFAAGSGEAGEVGIDVTYCNGAGVRVTYRLPLVFKYH